MNKILIFGCLLAVILAVNLASAQDYNTPPAVEEYDDALIMQEADEMMETAESKKKHHYGKKGYGKKGYGKKGHGKKGKKDHYEGGGYYYPQYYNHYYYQSYYTPSYYPQRYY